MRDFATLDRNEKDGILSLLKREPAKHALVLQNLTTWPEESKFHFIRHGDSLSYLHVSGHPAHRDGSTTLVLDGDPAEVEALLREIRPQVPFAVRESPASLESAVRAYFPKAKARLEHRMDVDRAGFKPKHQGKARQLEERDLPALCAFMGAPPQAAPRFMGWLKGARVFYGLEEEGRILAIGSSMVCLPEIFNIVSIETHRDHRGKGLATELTSALVAKCLEFTNDVCLTVFADNEPALRVYEKLGFRITEDRTWIDCKAD